MGMSRISCRSERTGSWVGMGIMLMSLVGRTTNHSLNVVPRRVVTLGGKAALLPPFGDRRQAGKSAGSPPRVAAPQAGVTLIEMMIVVTLIALVAGLSYPSLSSGLETLRLRSASDAIVALLNTSV